MRGFKRTHTETHAQYIIIMRFQAADNPVTVTFRSLLFAQTHSAETLINTGHYQVL